jgi:hypothetical protein
MDANNILFRCSSLGALMTAPRSKSELLSETCKKELVKIFVTEKYGREKDVQSKYTTKGLMVEEDSLTLYSRYKKQIFFKNEDRLKNDFITGTPDVLPEEDLIVKDIKSSWDIFTFFSSEHNALNKAYYWQIQGYCALTGAKSGRLAYCLVNTPDMLIQDEKRRLQYKMGVIDDANLSFHEACEKLEKLMIYDDLPLEERVLEIDIPRNDKDIESIYERVKDCREYMNEELFKCYPEPTQL